LLTVPEKVINPPMADGTAGQFRVTATRGVVVTEQVMEAVLVTTLAAHMSLAAAITVVVMEQAFAGTVKLPVKFAEAPGASVPIVNTGVLAAGRSLTTTTFVSVILPLLLTVPPKLKDPPGATRLVEQFIVTRIWDAVRMGQEELTESVTATPQMLVARTVELLLTEQTFAATVKLPVKFTDAPGANDAEVNIGVAPVRSLVTTTLVTVMLPVLRTVPLKVREPP